MRIFFSTILLCAAVIGTASAQPWRDTLWTRTYGGPNYEAFNAIAATPDGGFVAVGVSEPAWPYWHAYIMRADAQGNEIWSISYPGQSAFHNAEALDVAVMDAATYLVVGEGGTPSSAMVLWVDSSGVISNSRFFFGAGEAWFNSIAQTNDGNWVLAGGTCLRDEYISDAFIMKISMDGDSLWTRIFGGGETDIWESLVSLPDGSVIAGGYTNSWGAGGMDALLAKFDSIGDTVWVRALGTNLHERVSSVVRAANNDIMLAGDISSGSLFSTDMLLMRVDQTGSMHWMSTYGRLGVNDHASAMFIQRNQRIIIAGSSGAGYPNYDMLVAELEPNGDTLWTSAYGGLRQQVGTGLTTTSDGHLVVCGSNDLTRPGYADAWVVKIALPGNAQETTRETSIPRQSALLAYPNPFNPTTTLRFCLDRPQRVSLVVYDVTGREAARLLDRELPGGEHAVPLDGMPLSSGIYFARLEAASQLQTIKLVLLK